jgi:hypothetical protein
MSQRPSSLPMTGTSGCLWMTRLDEEEDRQQKVDGTKEMSQRAGRKDPLQVFHTNALIFTTKNPETAPEQLERVGVAPVPPVALHEPRDAAVVALRVRGHDGQGGGDLAAGELPVEVLAGLCVVFFGVGEGWRVCERECVGGGFDFSGGD